MSEVWRQYEVTDPAGNRLELRQMRDGDVLGQLERKTGEDWVLEKELSLADLIMPEQRLSEWEVRQIKDAARDYKPVSPTTAAAFSQALKLDQLLYLRGIKRVDLISDEDKWNGLYDPNQDAIVLQQKFEPKSAEEKVQIILHEAGHRGQFVVDPKAYEAFVKLGMDKLLNFLKMANAVHLQDWQENGIDDTAKAQEAFAESYSRFCLNREMPDEIRRFWQKRVSR